MINAVMVVIHIFFMTYAYTVIMGSKKTDWIMVIGMVANAIAAFTHIFKAVDYLLK